MAKVFLLTSDSDDGDATEALRLATSFIPPERHRFQGLHLGIANPFPHPAIRTPSLIDLRGWQRIRAAIRAFGPDVIHVHGTAAVRASSRMRLRVQLHSGVARSNVAIPFGVDPAPVMIEPRHDLPDDARIILFVGDFTDAADARSAVWAFDILRYTDPRWHLVCLGDGPTRERSEALSRSMGFDDYRAHFRSDRRELAYWLTRCHAAWLTHRIGGAMPAMGALAAGAMLVAFHTSALAKYCGEDSASTLVPKGDPVALASATLKLPVAPSALAKPPRFPASAMVNAYATRYDEAAHRGWIEHGRAVDASGSNGDSGRGQRHAARTSHA